MKTALPVMLLAEDNPAEADLILTSLTKDGFAGAVPAWPTALRLSQ